MPVAFGRMAAAAGAAVLATGILWVAASAHIAYGCATNDTPYLPLCSGPPADAESQQAEVRERIERNPGDSWAWVRLLAASGEEPKAGVLRGAAALAPNHAMVLRRRAVDALEQGDLARGVAILVQLLQYRDSAEAGEVLAQVAATPQGAELLRPHLKDSGVWLPRVLVAMKKLQLPPSAALPLVVEAARNGALAPFTRREYLRTLKQNGEWLDAYGLWIALHKREVPLLYNGAFDQQFVPDGFDWEFTPVTRSRAGVLFEQSAVVKRGHVLALEFTGRSFPLPILRQYVFAPPGTYRLSGEYMASKLRSEGGLAWVVACPATGRTLAAASSAMQESGGLWRSTELEFKVPADCGPVASLQLQPVQKYEATAGIKGRVELDALTLTRTGD